MHLSPEMAAATLLAGELSLLLAMIQPFPFKLWLKTAPLAPEIPFVGDKYRYTFTFILLFLHF